MSFPRDFRGLSSRAFYANFMGSGLKVQPADPIAEGELN
jgi:hypothetical protein